MQTRSCKTCGSEFEAGKHRRKYCSEDCYALMRDQQANERNARDAERRRAKLRTRECCICGDSFVSPHPNQLTCGAACKNQHDLAQLRNRKRPYHKVCANCGDEFDTRKPNGKYCSQACQRSSRIIKAVARTCPCGNRFEAIGPAKFCSIDCRSKYGRHGLKRWNTPRYKVTEKKVDRNTTTVRVLDKSVAGVYYSESEFWSELTRYRKNLDASDKREDDHGYHTAIETYWQFTADPGQIEDRGGERLVCLAG